MTPRILATGRRAKATAILSSSPFYPWWCKRPLCELKDLRYADFLSLYGKYTDSARLGTVGWCFVSEYKGWRWTFWIVAILVSIHELDFVSH